jgi:dual specificity phosphatase 12
MGERKRKDDVLSRDDFDAGPTSVDVIEPGLLLGKFRGDEGCEATTVQKIINVLSFYFHSGNLTTALDTETLQLHGVDHILTVDSVPLPRAVTENSHLKTKFIQGKS